MVYDPFFFRWTIGRQREYYVRIIATVHGCIAGPMGAYQFFYGCEDPKETMFTSIECVNTVKPVYVYLCCFSCSFIMCDAYWCYFYIQYSWKELAEYLFHHGCVFAGGVTAFALGR